MEPIFQRGPMHCRPVQCTRPGNVEKKWTHKINLTQIPTKPEDLNVKMEKDGKVLSISGKAEVTKERQSGMKIFSTHTWSKDVTVPEAVDQTTLSAKMAENIVTISADFKKHEITIERETEETSQEPVQKPVQEVAQEKMD
jgi:hypothetical protein